MKCIDVRPLLNLLFDGALKTKDSALVLDHMQSCSECQCGWNDLEQLQASFHDANGKLQLPEGLIAKISEKLTNEERKALQRFIQKYARL